jgi:hypothetical protein
MKQVGCGGGGGGGGDNTNKLCKYHRSILRCYQTIFKQNTQCCFFI